MYLCLIGNTRDVAVTREPASKMLDAFHNSSSFPSFRLPLQLSWLDQCWCVTLAFMLSSCVAYWLCRSVLKTAVLCGNRKSAIDAHGSRKFTGIVQDVHSCCSIVCIHAWSVALKIYHCGCACAPPHILLPQDV